MAAMLAEVCCECKTAGLAASVLLFYDGHMSFDPIIQLFGQIAVFLTLGLFGCVVWRGQAQLKWLIFTALFYLLYDFALSRGFGALANFPLDANWNWTGKAIAIGVSLSLAIWLGRDRVGLVWGRSGDPLALAITGGVGLLAAGLSLLFLNGGGEVDLETLAFQWTMPGLDEELFYRGVLLVALKEAFRERARILGAPIGFGGLLTCIMFGLAHALTYEDGSFAFDIITMAITGGPAVVLLWLRERTGSILLPIVAHNFANGIPTLIGMI
ncbi:MAG: CPBP family intramembrane glutamic endopeptidase [Pacificimonas sp.]